MADNAVEGLAAPSAGWLGLFAPDPERLEFTTRLALICSLTALVAEIYQTPDPALTVYIAFFLNRPERTVSLILSTAFVVIITVVIALTLFVANLVVNNSMWLVISIALISFVFLFLTAASRLRPVGGTVALIIAYALDLLGSIGVQSGELDTRALLYAWLFVAIPAGVSILVNLLLGPAPRHTVEQAIADRLRLSATVLRDPHSPGRTALAIRVRDGVAPILGQLRIAAMEKSVPVADVGALRQAALSCFALMSAVDALASSPEAELSGAVRVKLADAVDQLAHGMERGRPALVVPLDPPEEVGLSPLAQSLLAAIRYAVIRFAEPDTGPHAPPEKKKGGFLADDAFTNPEHVHYALKTTAAALFCYALYSLLDWPGIHTSFLTCYIVAQSTAAESVEKLSLRITGCLIGAAAGMTAIVFLTPHLTSIGGLMITVFVGSWLSAYVAAGGPRIEYAGLQMAFAFFLCVIQGSGPSFDLVTARDRIIGILLGNLVSYFAIVYVWPVTITRSVDPALAAALKQLAKVAVIKQPRERRLPVSQVQASLREVETDINLARYEPASIRSSAAWLSARRKVVEASQSLGALLLLSADERELSRVDAAARLNRLATRLAEPSDPQRTAPSWVTQPAHGWQTLPARINQELRLLEETLAPGASAVQASSHAPS